MRAHIIRVPPAQLQFHFNCAPVTIKPLHADTRAEEWRIKIQHGAHMALEKRVHAKSSHKLRSPVTTAAMVVSLLLQPHRYTSRRTLELRPAIRIGRDLLAEMSGRVIE